MNAFCWLAGWGAAPGVGWAWVCDNSGDGWWMGRMVCAKRMIGRRAAFLLSLNEIDEGKRKAMIYIITIPNNKN